MYKTFVDKKRLQVFIYYYFVLNWHIYYFYNNCICSMILEQVLKCHLCSWCRNLRFYQVFALKQQIDRKKLINQVFIRHHRNFARINFSTICALNNFTFSCYKLSVYDDKKNRLKFKSINHCYKLSWFFVRIFDRSHTRFDLSFKKGQRQTKTIKFINK